LASILAIKTQIKLSALINSITNFSKGTQLLLIFGGKLCGYLHQEIIDLRFGVCLACFTEA
jgi:hypothetical protein